ncbi:hypothetical protein DL93DRAFT_2071226 [Clavulina sp. PMI_390]|nr:hypothetical protein DL93DRAFT_2071226 [Clavulina sp. PMI_390]
MLGGKLRYVFALSFLGLSFRIYRYDLVTQRLIPIQLFQESQAILLDTAPREQWAHHVLTQSGYDYLTAVFFTVYSQLRTVPTDMTGKSPIFSLCYVRRLTSGS